MQSSSVLKLMVFRNGPVSLLKKSSLVSINRVPEIRSASTQASPSTSSPATLVTRGEEDVSSGSGSEGRQATISKAMHAYLKRAKENQEFMDRQEKEFVFGRRHLANMMGKDPETFSQKDIDEAIKYLFPSGLYSPLARPVMRPPTEIYPKQKAAQFDKSGRPHHPFFYTNKPNFYFMLHEMVGKLNSLNKLESAKTDTDLSEDTSLAGSVWLTKDELSDRLLEKISDQMYNEFISCLERLAGHPKKEKEIEFIKLYRTPLTKQSTTDTLPVVTLEPDGRKSAHVPLCMKKTGRADVLVTVPGTGEITINGEGLDYFVNMGSRAAVIAPLQLVGWLGKCDIVANVEGGVRPIPKPKNIYYESPVRHRKHVKKVETPGREYGETVRAISVRYGIATALAALGADMEKLRLAGYLTSDRRRTSRNLPGHHGPNRPWTWKKR